MAGLYWIQTVLHSDGVLERIFKQVDFLKNQQMTKKQEKLSQLAKS